MPKTMRRHMRKPQPDEEGEERNDWHQLYERAVAYTQDIDPNKDPRVKMLRGGEESPKRILKKLSIIDESDLEREFGTPDQ